MKILREQILKLNLEKEETSKRVIVNKNKAIRKGIADKDKYA